MIHIYPQILRPVSLCLTLGLVSLLFGSTAQAQIAPTYILPKASYRNVLRIDVGGVLLRNLGAIAFKENLVLPLLGGYERQLGSRTSANLEILINGGNGGELEEKTSGLALQGRYYFYQGKHTGLAGFYVAPVLSSRLIKQPDYYGPKQARQLLGGAGALLGAQVPVSKSGRLLLDVAGGVMTWRRLSANPSTGYGYSSQSYYEHHGTVPDVRIGLGCSF